MKIKINKKYEEVYFWSFVKCVFLAHITILGITYGTLILLGLLLGVLNNG